MTVPPSLALRLLNRLAPGDEELAGDLVEEYQSGRSRAWFWSQVVTAIAIGAARSVRANVGRAAGAILVGLLLSAVGDAALARAVGYVGGWMTPMLWLLMLPVVFGLEQFMIGVIIGRLSRPVGPAVALAYAATLLGLSTITFAWILFGDVARGERLWAVSQMVLVYCIAMVTAVLGATWATGSRNDRVLSLPEAGADDPSGQPPPRVVL